MQDLIMIVSPGKTIVRVLLLRTSQAALNHCTITQQHRFMIIALGPNR